MGIFRGILWAIGAALLVCGLAAMYVETGLNRWVSYGVAGAGLLILVGLLIVSAAGTPVQPTRSVARSLVIERTVPVNAVMAVPARPLEAGETEFTGVSHARRREADGTVVDGVVKTERRVRGRRSFVRKTKTVTRRRPAGRPQKGRTHRSRRTTVTRRRP